MAQQCRGGVRGHCNSVSLLLQFLRVCDDTKVEEVLELMLDHWNMDKPYYPNLVITVIGGAKNFKLDGKKKEIFNIGLVDVSIFSCLCARHCLNISSSKLLHKLLDNTRYT